MLRWAPPGMGPVPVDWMPVFPEGLDAVATASGTYDGAEGTIVSTHEGSATARCRSDFTFS
ncbi:MAG: hypothetical protein GY898_13055 [Proteobacteria bacterium]|nr:hypothetical protein [Pseudomonadota bacterium]